MFCSVQATKDARDAKRRPCTGLWSLAIPPFATAAAACARATMFPTTPAQPTAGEGDLKFTSCGAMIND